MRLIYLSALFNIAAASASETYDDAHNQLQAASPEAIELQDIYFKLRHLKSVGSTPDEKPSPYRNLSDTECAKSKLNVPVCPPAMEQRYPLVDGSCNNRIDEGRGQAFRPLKRLLPAKYDDGVETIRKPVMGGDALPSARVVANQLQEAARVIAKQPKPPQSELTHMFTQWGQFIIHDIVHTPVIKGMNHTDLDCNCAHPHPECLNIPIEEDDKQYSENKTCFVLPRSIPTPSHDCTIHGAREQLNQISSYIDGTTVYGVNKFLVEEIRDPNSEAGELKTSTKYSGETHGDQLPQMDELNDMSQGSSFACPLKLAQAKSKCMLAGDKRINENAGLAAMHTIFMREHNRIARALKEKNPHWNSDLVFEETRLIIIALHQVITYNEYLPALLGPKFVKRYGLAMAKSGYFYGYDASVDASVTNEFTTAAFRFGHSMINDKLSRPSANWEHRQPDLQMKESLFNPSESLVNDTHSNVDPILRGLCQDMSLKCDTNFPESMKDFLFAKRNEFGKDLFAINIQRGRDHGLSGYNDYREFFGMQRARTFDELAEIPHETRKYFQQIYEHVDDIDVYAGGLAETPLAGAPIGPMFAHMIGAQFRDLKIGDRYYFENGGCETMFTPQQVNELRKVTLSSLICTCTDTDTVQLDPFRAHYDPQQHWMLNPSRGGGKPNPRLSCNEIYKLDLEAWREPYINAEDLNGFADTGSWTEWLPPLGNPKSLDLDILHRERPQATCLNSVKSQMRFVANDVQKPQIRFMCPAGVIIGTDFPPACLDRGKWTNWFDQSTPKGQNLDDIELTKDLHKTRPNELCDEPIYMQVQTVNGIPARETGDVFEVFDARRGFVCRASHQPSGRCQDYRARFFCATDTTQPKLESRLAELDEDEDVDLAAFSWTSWFSADGPNFVESTGDLEYLSKARYHRNDICANPVAIDAVTVKTETDALLTGDVFKIFSPAKGLVCLNEDQTGRDCSDYKVRYLCEKPLSPLVYASPEDSPAEIIKKVESIVDAVKSKLQMNAGNPIASDSATDISLPITNSHEFRLAISNAKSLCNKYDLCCMDADLYLS